MHINKTDIKAFKRVLKELGIYYVWCKNRRCYLRKKAKFGSFWDVGGFPYFASIILYSFKLEDTNEPDLWRIIGTGYDFNIREIKNSNNFDKAKKRIKEHLK